MAIATWCCTMCRMRLSGDGFVVTLKDISRDVFVELHYTMDPTTGVLGRSAVIVNRTKTPLMIEQAAAARWNLPRGNDYRLRYLSGRWAAEWTLNERKIAAGQDGAGEQARVDGTSEQSVVCD